MINIPIKSRERLLTGVKRFVPIVKKAKDNDINESDTATIISDIMAEVFNYDKYTELTSEFSVKKTYCDLAVKLDGKPVLLIECKAIGLNLKDDHIRQAVDYGSNSGVEWIILTNAVNWRIYKVLFTRPVAHELVYEFDLTTLNLKRQTDLEMLFYLTKEALIKPNSKSSLDDFRAQKQILSKYIIGQILLTESIQDTVRKYIKRMVPEARVSNEEIRQVISEEILKREILDAEPAADAKKRVAKADKVNSPRVKKTVPQDINSSKSTEE